MGATTPQEANVSEDIPDWREPVDKSSAPVSLDVLDIVTEGNYGVGFIGYASGNWSAATSSSLGQGVFLVVVCSHGLVTVLQRTGPCNVR